MKEKLARLAENDEDGFGLVEIVVSMFMLAILAIAFLPLLIQGYKQTAASTTMATATQLVQQQMESTRTSNTCTGIGSVVLVPTTTSTTVTDPRGVSLTATKTVAACPITTLVLVGTVKVTSSVKRNDTNAVITSATTLVYVGGL